MSQTIAFNLPCHVAIIMDGNGRWAAQRNKPRWFGHRAGGEALVKIIKAAAARNLEVLSVFAFSNENWNRPKQEVDYLMKSFLNGLRDQIKKFEENNIQLKFIGDFTRLSIKLREQISKAQMRCEKNTGMKFIVAVDYGGQQDILHAVRKIAQEVSDGTASLSQIGDDFFSKYIALSGIPYPDLLIRTSGERRISNFFLWQIAYTELYFTEELWPDFNEKSFDRALDSYANRKRRFGKVE